MTDRQPAFPVDRLTVRVYTVPTDHPEADGTLSWDATTLILVEARSGGTAGLGWTYGAPATAALVRAPLAAAVLGRDALDTAGAYEAMRRALRNAGRPGAGGYALSAVDVALWDLSARLLGLPLVRLLGGRPRPVAVYGSGGFTSYPDRLTERQLRGWTDGQGIPRVKIKIGEARGTRPERDLERIAAARRTVGPDTALYVDANGAFTAKQAIRLAAAFAEDGVTWFEEPVPSDDLPGLAAVRAAVSPDVAAGEYGDEPRYFAAMAPAVDCLQADATRCGGLTGFLRAAAVAEAAGVPLSAHCAPHVHAHAAAARPGVRHLEWFHDHVRVEGLLFDGVLDPAGGAVTPGASGEPGHGLRLAADRAAPYLAEDWSVRPD
ncbi:enolase C-terminal domain-like protein [Kitasatospora cheerisanensis]|uniref:Mandalate racemase n=1 Tax=Kitasatospora cheerisanensis KCTC 2395 TaxID=1348663 RepID=A0A066Z1A7_9ACTN|nr:enolase C-terminal domain-like protein [Kitasatospora cheerisanensis]KDN87563.1 mandalate racemase [Kitasatospora cheerisanensis KCTC 2395]